MNRLPIALTMGEPAGIGGEIALKTWLRRADSVPAFFLIDSPRRIERLARTLGLDVRVKSIARPADAATAFPAGLPILPIEVADDIVPGQPNARHAPAVIGAIERAVAMVRAGEAAAIVTNPIQKKPLYDAGFPYPGHTEFLASLAGGGTPVMMLAIPALRVVPLTIHVPLVRAIASIRTDAIVATGEIVLAALKRDFGLSAPRLAVAGLNPHAGESGSLGFEDETFIRPAVEILRRRGHAVLGPLVPDVMFADGQRQRYDAALCMYHDQALIPLKTLDFERGVNITLGLPFVRTSPDHGTALDIAGTGVASPISLMEALKLARAMADRRAAGNAA
ncbi:MAG: 4-hydroxythreonine-4-phosphate dehydrogenase PdxA [Alphaproteobacteria bacterium]